MDELQKLNGLKYVNVNSIDGVNSYSMVQISKKKIISHIDENKIDSILGDIYIRKRKK
ncbi:hypothetical protein [Clostridium massiliamazoniense]|uniref:hypothetical protein n=1 Tax=Clostridium massiliamazoniense TaxID=1347366 RepID=UPI0018D02FF9|nr:hypothetical protein [Clostridium massiliamazoniense]